MGMKISEVNVNKQAEKKEKTPVSKEIDDARWEVDETVPEEKDDKEDMKVSPVKVVNDDDRWADEEEQQERHSQTARTQEKHRSGYKKDFGRNSNQKDFY